MELLTIVNAWLRVEQEQEADDFASAFVGVSSLAFCVSKAKVGRPQADRICTGPDYLLFICCSLTTVCMYSSTDIFCLGGALLSQSLQDC
jgi:hypothetical protein